MNWVSLVIAVIGLAREFLKFQMKKQGDKKDKVKEVKEFRNEIKKARKTGDTQSLEDAFYSTFGNGGASSKLSGD